MWSNCLFVALGGGLGAVGRYLLSLIAAPWSFPVMTLLTNFLGAVVIGAVAQAAGQLPMSKSAVLFLKTGLCGGFTTFSTFSLETVELLEQGRWAAGGGYILAREPAAISVGAILRALEGPLAATECVVSECERANGCAMHALWLRIHRGVNEVMDSISLQDMLEDAARCCQEAESEATEV